MKFHKRVTLIEIMVVVAMVGILGIAVCGPIGGRAGCIDTASICKPRCMDALNPNECLKLCKEFYSGE